MTCTILGSRGEFKCLWDGNCNFTGPMWHKLDVSIALQVFLRGNVPNSLKIEMFSIYLKFISQNSNFIIIIANNLYYTHIRYINFQK